MVVTVGSIMTVFDFTPHVPVLNSSPALEALPATPAPPPATPSKATPATGSKSSWLRMLTSPKTILATLSSKPTSDYTALTIPFEAPVAARSQFAYATVFPLGLMDAAANAPLFPNHSLPAAVSNGRLRDLSCFDSNTSTDPGSASKKRPFTCLPSRASADDLPSTDAVTEATEVAAHDCVGDSSPEEMHEGTIVDENDAPVQTEGKAKAVDAMQSPLKRRRNV